MTEENGTDKKVTKKHVLTGYTPRGDAQIEKWLSCKGMRDSDDVLHKFNLILPVPTDDDEAREFYGYSLAQIIEKGVSQIGNDWDDTFKEKLFAGCDDGDEVGMIENEDHLAAQQAIDAKRYEPAKSTGKSTSVSDVVGKLVAAGVLDESALETVTNRTELDQAIAALNA